MTHLGDHVSALVDHQLPPADAEEAHVHLASCPACLDAVEAEREVKARLTGLTGPEPDTSLVQRLFLIPTAVELSSPTAHGTALPVHRPPSARVDHSRGPVGRSDPSHPGAERSQGRRRVTAVMLGTMSLLGAGVVGLRSVALADSAPVVPPVTEFVTEYAASTSMLPFGRSTSVWPVGYPGGAR